MADKLFDTWTDEYDTPWGRQVKRFELKLLMELLAPDAGDLILDVGCGTGIFTGPVMNCGARVTGLDLSLPMLKKGSQRLGSDRFLGICADMKALPFPDDYFDRTFSMTAIEFVAHGAKALAELHRVTRPGGTLVVTTLNSLSPWAEQRLKKAEQGHDLFKKIYFRSPADMMALLPPAGVECPMVKTAVHFQKQDPIREIPAIEAAGGKHSPETGAFLCLKWKKAARTHQGPAQ